MKKTKVSKNTTKPNHKESSKDPLINKHQTSSNATEALEKKHKVGTIHEADEYMKHNEYIIRGYRINFDSGKKIIKSLFMIHNESVNVWTHLVGAMVIVLLIVYTAIFLHYHKEIITDFDFSKINSELKELTKPILPSISNIANSFYSTTLNYISIVDDKINEYAKFIDLKVNCISCAEEILRYISEMKEIVANSIHNTNESISHELGNLLDFIKHKEEQWLSIYLQSSSHKEENGSFILPKWPLFITLIGAVACLGFSATFHLFIAHSEKVNNLFNRLDYAGIALLIVGSCYPPNYYLFNCDIGKYLIL